MFFKFTARYVYIVKCSDGTFYVGVTWNPRRRIDQHNGYFWGGAEYSRSRRPVTLVHLERYKTKKDALYRERIINSMTPEEQQLLVDHATKKDILDAI